jgi:hypothetical protein
VPHSLDQTASTISDDYSCMRRPNGPIAHLVEYIQRYIDPIGHGAQALRLRGYSSSGRLRCVCESLVWQ